MALCFSSKYDPIFALYSAFLPSFVQSMPSEKRPCPNTVQGMLEECDSSEEDPLLFVVTEQGRLEAKVTYHETPSCGKDTRDQWFTVFF